MVEARSAGGSFFEGARARGARRAAVLRLRAYRLMGQTLPDAEDVKRKGHGKEFLGPNTNERHRARELARIPDDVWAARVAAGLRLRALRKLGSVLPPATEGRPRREDENFPVGEVLSNHVREDTRGLDAIPAPLFGACCGCARTVSNDR